MQPEDVSQQQQWSERMAALRHLPVVGKLVWQSDRVLVATALVLRIMTGLAPLAILAVAKRIIDVVVERRPADAHLWTLLAAEFALASLGFVLAKGLDYCDARIADEFTHSLSLRVMDQAARLDLASFEDSNFYDKLERARVQATDRVLILNSLGNLIQRTVTLMSLAAGVIWYSPWLFALVFVCLLPAFAGETHFAFLSYSLAHKLTPLRRELDYLRFLGSSRESAKEIKVFALAEHLRNRYEHVSDEVMSSNRQLTKRRLAWGVLLAIIGSIGYYGGYVAIVIGAAQGKITVGTLTFLAGAIAGANSEFRTVFSLFSTISEQALYLADLVVFLSERPKIESRPNAIPAPRPIRQGLEFKNVSFAIPAQTVGS